MNHPQSSALVYDRLAITCISKATVIIKLVIVMATVLLLLAQVVPAQTRPNLSEVDRIRIAEAFRMGAALGNRVWKDWDKAPFAVLLVTPDHEFLIRHPRPSNDFTLIGYDSVLQSNVYLRKRQYGPNLLATFPVGGIPTIVMGQAENTSRKTSTPWVVTMLHEHFHQLQYSQPTYYAAVDALNLSRGDQTGMWMLNFAFPYKDAKVKEQFSALSRLLAETLQAEKKSEFRAKLNEYLAARQVFQEMLSPDDYKYFSFQVWQEGIARYIEYRIANLAAKKYKPSKEFRALKDYTPFSDVADSILNKQVLSSLLGLQIDKSERIVFYPFGAAEGLLLDRVNPKWQRRYFAEKFYVEKYFLPTKE